MPSDVSPETSWFDRFAEAVSRVVSRAWFFAACVAMVAVWMPSYFLFRSVDTWQLVINTTTTILTQLLVALLQNSQKRFEDRTIKQNEAILRRLEQIERLPQEGSPGT